MEFQNIWVLPITSMYGIYTYICKVDFYGKCREIYHTWMPWVIKDSELVFKTEKQNWMMDEQIIQTNWIASRYGNDTLNLKNMHCRTRHSILRIPYTYIYNLLRVILGSWNLFAVLTIALPAKNVAQLLYLRNSPPFINCDNKDYKLL